MRGSIFDDTFIRYVYALSSEFIILTFKITVLFLLSYLVKEQIIKLFDMNL